MAKYAIGVVVAMLLISFVGGVAHSDASGARTVVTVYKPSRMHVLRTVSGSCWTSSIAVARSDAFRCTAGNTIWDPCFLADKTTVACPTDLLKDRGTLMKLTALLPRNENSESSDSVWAFSLASGAFCQIGTGTITPGYPYYCTYPPVCSVPKSVPGSAAWESTCGKPKAAISITALRVEKVTRVWK